MPIARITKVEAQRLVNKFADSSHHNQLPTKGQEFILWPFGSKVTNTGRKRGQYVLIGYAYDGKDVTIPLYQVRKPR